MAIFGLQCQVVQASPGEKTKLQERPQAFVLQDHSNKFLKWDQLPAEERFLGDDEFWKNDCGLYAVITASCCCFEKFHQKKEKNLELLAAARQAGYIPLSK